VRGGSSGSDPLERKIPGPIPRPATEPGSADPSDLPVVLAVHSTHESERPLSILELLLRDFAPGEASLEDGPRVWYLGLRAPPRAAEAPKGEHDHRGQTSPERDHHEGHPNPVRAVPSVHHGLVTSMRHAVCRSVPRGELRSSLLGSVRPPMRTKPPESTVVLIHLGPKVPQMAGSPCGAGCAQCPGRRRDRRPVHRPAAGHDLPVVAFSPYMDREPSSGVRADRGASGEGPLAENPHQRPPEVRRTGPREPAYFWAFAPECRWACARTPDPSRGRRAPPGSMQAWRSRAAFAGERDQRTRRDPAERGQDQKGALVPASVPEAIRPHVHGRVRRERRRHSR
jgi:hypothetical protein